MSNVNVSSSGYVTEHLMNEFKVNQEYKIYEINNRLGDIERTIRSIQDRINIITENNEEVNTKVNTLIGAAAATAAATGLVYWRGKKSKEQKPIKKAPGRQEPVAVSRRRERGATRRSGAGSVKG